MLRCEWSTLLQMLARKPLKSGHFRIVGGFTSPKEGGDRSQVPKSRLTNIAVLLGEIGWVSLVDDLQPPGKPGIAIYFSIKTTKTTPMVTNMLHTFP